MIAVLNIILLQMLGTFQRFLLEFSRVNLFSLQITEKRKKMFSQEKQKKRLLAFYVISTVKKDS
jgi:hypothetical protein